MADSSYTPPKPPSGMGTGGRKLWNDIVSRYELAQHELRLLTEACRTADDCDRFAKVIAVDGDLITNPSSGLVKPHPLHNQLRDARLSLARLLGALRIPEEYERDASGLRRPNRRMGVHRPRRVS